MNKTFKTLFLSVIISGASINAFAGALDISGYFDVAFLSPKNQSSYFHQQHLNLIMQHQVDQFKFFSELEFEDTPNIDYGRIPGPAGGGVDGGKGRLFLERAYGEAEFSKFFNIRVGQMLTPTHYYLNHYPSIIVNYTNPLTLKTIFNYNELGVLFFGDHKSFHYDLWTGRGPNTDASNTIQNESGTNLGGKLTYNKRTRKIDLSASLIGATYSLGDFPDNGAKPHGSDLALGAEFTMTLKGFTLWSEFGTREMKASTTTNSNKKTAYFIQGSYAIEVGEQGELIPYLMFDGLKQKEASDGLEARAINRTIIGLAYRPVPIVTWKIEYENGGSYRPTNPDGSLLHIADANYIEDRIVTQLVYFYN